MKRWFFYIESHVDIAPLAPWSVKYSTRVRWDSEPLVEAFAPYRILPEPSAHVACCIVRQNLCIYASYSSFIKTTTKFQRYNKKQQWKNVTKHYTHNVWSFLHLKTRVQRNGAWIREYVSPTDSARSLVITALFVLPSSPNEWGIRVEADTFAVLTFCPRSSRAHLWTSYTQNRKSLPQWL